MSSTETKSKPVPYRVGGWLPSDHEMLARWISDLVATVEAKKDVELLPVIKAFRQMIYGDPTVYMLFSAMLTQDPNPWGPPTEPRVRTIDDMLRLFNEVMTTAPKYYKSGLVGFPINAILDWAMATPAGFPAFLNDKANCQFKLMLDYWGQYLRSTASAYVLNETADGWFGPNALTEDERKQFQDEYVCDPTALHWGFTSWDDFFTRKFRAGKRPIDSPDDPSVIVNACESAPYRLSEHVKKYDTFWIKGQPYSLAHMLADDSDEFVDGTVYQAFLSAKSYHRWHSPVDGKVVKCLIKPGTYYSETPAEGYDDAGPNESQGYITEVATRAIIFIEADDPPIGLMCVMPVGMAEVSTCDITVKEGQHVTKGDELGMFHFGGSTHCLLFCPGVKLKFDFHDNIEPGINASNIPVNSRIATVVVG